MKGALLLIFLISLSAAACSTAPPKPKPAKTKPIIYRSKTMSANSPLVRETKGLPAALTSEPPLWETLTAGRTANEPPTATRLYPSGELFGYGATRRTYQDEKIGREPAPLAWRLDAHLSKEGISAVQKRLEMDFAPMPDDTVPAPLPPGCQIWRATIDKKTHTLVRTQPSRDWKDLPPVLRTVHEAIQKGIVPGGVPLEQKE